MTEFVRSSFFTGSKVEADFSSVWARSALVDRNSAAVRQSGSPLNSAFRQELQGMDLADKIAAIHKRVMPEVEATGIFDFYRSKDEADLSLETRRQVAELFDNIEELRQYNELPFNLAVERKIEQAYQEVDEDQGDDNWDKLIAARVRRMAGIRVVFDFDNTMTDHSKLNKDGPIDPSRLGDALVAPIQGRNLEHFPYAYVAGWRPLLRTYPEVFKEGGRTAPIREGIDYVVKMFIERGIKVNILSMNFFPYIKGAVGELFYGERIYIAGITAGSMLTAAKNEFLREMARQDPTSALIYIGDSVSDISTIKAKNIVAGFGALEGYAFQGGLQDQNVPHFTYKTGYDIAEQVLSFCH